MEPADEARGRAIALLEGHHSFPGPFDFRVVVRPAARASAVEAVAAVVGGADPVLEVTERPSSGGAYLALRVRVQVADAVQVLEVYEALRHVEDVVTVL